MAAMLKWCAAASMQCVNGDLQNRYFTIQKNASHIKHN